MFSAFDERFDKNLFVETLVQFNCPFWLVERNVFHPEYILFVSDLLSGFKACIISETQYGIELKDYKNIPSLRNTQLEDVVVYCINHSFTY